MPQPRFTSCNSAELIFVSGRRPATHPWVTRVRRLLLWPVWSSMQISLTRSLMQGCFPWVPAQTWIVEAFSHDLHHKFDHLKTYPPPVTWQADWHAACCRRIFLANATPGGYHRYFLLKYSAAHECVSGAGARCLQWAWIHSAVCGCGMSVCSVP